MSQFGSLQRQKHSHLPIHFEDRKPSTLTRRSARKVFPVFIVSYAERLLAMALYLGRTDKCNFPIFPLFFFNRLLRVIDSAQTHVHMAAANRCFPLSGANMIPFVRKSSFYIKKPDKRLKRCLPCSKVRRGILLSDALLLL